jgi:acetylornithine/succinyldiaminopimelate/putrescine aminotransferase
LEQCTRASERFAQHLSELQANCELVVDIRRAGLMIGIELEIEGAPIVANCLNEGLLINCTHDTVLRLLPAMNISDAEIDRGMNILSEAVFQAAAGMPQAAGNG